MRGASGYLTKLAGLLLTAAFIQPPAQSGETGEPPLFTSEKPLEATLRADWHAIVRARADTERIWQGELDYLDEDGEQRTIPVGLTTRGLSRLDRNVCSFPGLFLHFERNDVDGSAFAGQEVLPLVSHCRRSPPYQQYVVKEYLLYRVYNLITDLSLRARLVNMTYEPDGRGKVFTGLAFFVENYNGLASRFGGEVVQITPFHPNKADPLEMSLLEVYQYLIGNTDWSVVYQHNIVLIRKPGGKISAVPYDFDSAGAVGTVYARPDERLAISSVRTRLFRGVCRNKKFLKLALDHVRARRADIEDLYRSQPALDERELAESLEYLDDFYEVIDDPKRMRKELLDECRKIRGRIKPERDP